jgi:hypothetical protein
MTGLCPLKQVAVQPIAMKDDNSYEHAQPSPVEPGSTVDAQQFTEEDDEKLRQVCTGQKRIKWRKVRSQYFPARTEESLRRRWCELKRQDRFRSLRPNARFKYFKWTPGDDRLLWEMKTQKASDEELVKALGRSLDACNRRYEILKKAEQTGASQDIAEDEQDEEAQDGEEIEENEEAEEDEEDE